MQKKRILFFDCFSGISGDMTLGALLDLGLDRQVFLQELEKLHVDGYKISFNKAVKNGITGNYVKVHLEHEVREGHDIHEHQHHPQGHHHEHRNLMDINRIIEESGITSGAKDLSKRIFLRVAKAEAKNVKVYGLSGYFIHKEHNKYPPTVIIGFANLTETQIQTGIALLKEAWSVDGSKEVIL